MKEWTSKQNVEGHVRTTSSDNTEFTLTVNNGNSKNCIWIAQEFVKRECNYEREEIKAGCMKTCDYY